MNHKKIFTKNIFKTNFILIITILFIASCTQNHVPEKYSIDQFYKNNRIGGGAFSDDETKLLVSSDESGIFNVYEIDIVSGEKTQKTFSEKESFFAIDYLPETYRRFALFQVSGMDHTLNESGWVTSITGQMRIDMDGLEAATGKIVEEEDIVVDTTVGKDKSVNFIDLTIASREEEKESE